jgi:uncharacterized protein (DUF488 family)
MKKHVIFTIGHSIHPINEFVELLQAHGINEIVDVRSIPMSRYNPQFNSATLKRSLRQANIKYKLLKKLGGLRHTTKDSINLGWHNTSWRCHRSLIADALTKKGWLVRDIMSRITATKHRLTSFLKIKKGQIIYPARDII